MRGRLNCSRSLDASEGAGADGRAGRADAAGSSALFGAYRAIRLLGRGGMSAVYLAERADGQFEQKVALKVMAGYLADRDFFDGSRRSASFWRR